MTYLELDGLSNQCLNSSTTLLTRECFWCLFLPDLCRNVSTSVNTSLCSLNISCRHSAIFLPPSGEESTALASSTHTSSSYIINGFLYSWRIGSGSEGKQKEVLAGIIMTRLFKSCYYHNYIKPWHYQNNHGIAMNYISNCLAL